MYIRPRRRRCPSKRMPLPDHVKALLPEAAKTLLEEEKTDLRLKSQGVWFFFNKNGIVETIRLDTPFKGNINGVKIGDSTDKMREIVGKQHRTFKRSNSPDSYFYYIDDRTTVRFAIDDEDNIQTVFLVK